ncbi:unnamed protein product, partial [Ectocarpus sp. 12 AP-2014]
PTEASSFRIICAAEAREYCCEKISVGGHCVPACLSICSSKAPVSNHDPFAVLAASLSHSTLAAALLYPATVCSRFQPTRDEQAQTKSSSCLSRGRPGPLCCLVCV